MNTHDTTTDTAKSWSLDELSAAEFCAVKKRSAAELIEAAIRNGYRLPGEYSFSYFYCGNKPAAKEQVDYWILNRFREIGAYFD